MPSDLIVRGGADRSGKIFDDGSWWLIETFKISSDFI